LGHKNQLLSMHKCVGSRKTVSDSAVQYAVFITQKMIFQNQNLLQKRKLVYETSQKGVIRKNKSKKKRKRKIIITQPRFGKCVSLSISLCDE
jgi:hypothetical protein